MNTSSQHPLPSSLDVDSSTPTSHSALLHLDVEGLQVKYMGPGAHKDDAATIRTNHPVPPDSHLYYFEVHVASQGENGAIGVGFMAGDVHLACMPGWFPRSYGYHGDDGKRFGGDGCGQTYGRRFTTGDTVGALFSRADRSIHFFLNGQHLGVAFLYVEEPQLYPCVGFHSPGAEVELNLGLPDSRPFSMDLSTIAAASKQQVVSREDYHMVTQLLAAVAEGNLRSIRNLVETCAAVAPAIVPAGAIPRLVELRVSAKPGVKHAAERVFGTLTLRPDTMPAIVRVAVAQLDIRVPRMASDIISAAEAVYMLAVHDTARAAIVHAGAIPLLVTLLRGNSIAVKHATAVVLFDLAFNDAAKSAIVQEGAIPHLVALLQPSSHVRQHAALLLGKLAFDAATQSAIVQAGAVPHLTAMLADAPAKQIIAATVLDKLGCSSADGASAISQAVQRLGGSGDDSVHWAAAVAAAAQPSSAGGSTSATPRAEAVPQLLALLNSSDWSVQHAAGMALMTLGCADAGIPKPVRQRISFFQHPDEQIEQLVDECVQIMQGDPLLRCWWMPPEQLGTMYKHLGGGASAEVWLHMKGDLPVVAKHFSLATCDDGLDEKVSPAAVAKSFIVEVYNLARLARASNPNIVSLRGFTSSGPGQLAIVLEWVQGRTLADVLHEGDVPCATLWAWAMDVAQALSCLHSQQPPIVHRDLKPINIIIGMDGHAKLIDFGVSKQWMDRDVHGTATQFTPTWMPPELGKTAPVWTVKSDVYPFGLLLWHLLSKEEPFGGDEWGLLMGLVPRQLELPKSAHPGLAQLIQECTCEAPEQRPDMSQVVARLEALQDAFSLAEP